MANILNSLVPKKKALEDYFDAIMKDLLEHLVLYPMMLNWMIAIL